MFLMKNRQIHICGFHFVAKYTHCGFQRESVEKNILYNYFLQLSRMFYAAVYTGEISPKRK
jgi:hypothetical protein